MTFKAVFYAYRDLNERPYVIRKSAVVPLDTKTATTLINNGHFQGITSPGLSTGVFPSGTMRKAVGLSLNAFTFGTGEQS